MKTQIKRFMSHILYVMSVVLSIALTLSLIVVFGPVAFAFLFVGTLIVLSRQDLSFDSFTKL